MCGFYLTLYALLVVLKVLRGKVGKLYVVHGVVVVVV